MTITSYAEESKVGFVDIQKAVISTTEWKRSFETFKKDFAKEKKKIKSREDRVKKMLVDINKQSFVLDPELKKKKEDKIAVKVFPTKAVDTTGAGDLFAAGALYGIIKNYTLQESAIIGSYCASEVVSQMGGRMPVGSDADAEQIIQKYQNL
jgi:sugar/nucleoside kinase (ribokinase family)